MADATSSADSESPKRFPSSASLEPGPIIDPPLPRPLPFLKICFLLRIRIQLPARGSASRHPPTPCGSWACEMMSCAPPVVLPTVALPTPPNYPPKTIQRPSEDPPNPFQRLSKTPPRTLSSLIKTIKTNMFRKTMI